MNIKHLESDTRLYKVWDNMLTRSCNPNIPNAHNYSKRGISVCDEWFDYITFSNWAFANGYQDGLVLDRKNTNGNYEPTNCRFITAQQSIINTRKRKGTSSVFRGVNWNNRDKVWRATITINKKQTYLGCFDYELDAAFAYDDAAHKAFGSFARLNFPERILQCHNHN